MGSLVMVKDKVVPINKGKSGAKLTRLRITKGPLGIEIRAQDILNLITGSKETDQAAGLDSLINNGDEVARR